MAKADNCPLFSHAIAIASFPRPSVRGGHLKVSSVGKKFLVDIPVLKFSSVLFGWVDFLVVDFSLSPWEPVFVQ